MVNPNMKSKLCSHIFFYQIIYSIQKHVGGLYMTKHLEQFFLGNAGGGRERQTNIGAFLVMVGEGAKERMYGPIVTATEAQ